MQTQRVPDEFKNEPFTDFTKPDNAEAMRDADLEIDLAQAGPGRRAELRESSEKGAAWLAALSKIGPV
mgnify:CR=1 FL=1